LVGGTNEFGQVGVCANHAVFAIDHVSPLCGALWRRAQGQEFFLPGSLSLHGFWSTDLSRKFARYRSVPACASGQAVPHGHQEPGVAEYSRRCQREPRLAHLRPTLPSRSSPLPVVFMPQNRLASISTTRSTLWMPAPSTCVCRSFLGLRFARAQRLLLAPRLRYAPASCPIQRSHNRQAAGVSHQQ